MIITKNLVTNMILKIILTIILLGCTVGGGYMAYKSTPAAMPIGALSGIMCATLLNGIIYVIWTRV